MLMKKFLLSFLGILPVLGASVYAAPVAMSLFSGGLSVLDSLLYIGIGIALIGALFLCIAFTKPSKKEAKIESPFDDYLENITTPEEETSLTEERDTIPETDNDEDTVADIDDETKIEPATDEPDGDVTESAASIDSVEEPTEDEQEPALEEETDLEEAPVLEEEPEAPEETPQEEEKIYPKLILTNVKTNDFVILPLYEETTIGRKTDNDLVLNDITISGLHCKILYQENKVYIQDENSTNGTFVNEERISEKTELHKGDKLLLGKQEFNVSINE